MIAQEPSGSLCFFKMGLAYATLSYGADLNETLSSGISKQAQVLVEREDSDKNSFRVSQIYEKRSCVSRREVTIQNKKEGFRPVFEMTIIK
jgi:hypothetical protein